MRVKKVKIEDVKIGDIIISNFRGENVEVLFNTTPNPLNGKGDFYWRQDVNVKGVEAMFYVQSGGFVNIKV